MWTRGVDGGSVHTNFLTGVGLETRRVYGSTANFDIFTEGWLDTGSIFTFSNVDISACVLSALRTRSFDVNIVGGLVVVFSTTIRNFELDVS